MKKTMKQPIIKIVLAVTLMFMFGSSLMASVKPLKVYILAGQSNMQGLGTIASVNTPGTLEYTVANDPDKAYQFLVDPDGKWVVRDEVWIRYISKHGGLTPGYGGGHDAQPQYIGPELGFGHFIGNRLENPVLIIKASWGGKSLGVDFRPPSSGGETGHYYKEVLRLVKETVSDLQTYVPDYQDQGYEIAGFAWHQGWNDRINPKFTAEYAENMANFIRDMRKDLRVPKLPFVIATTGMDGEKRYTDLERAQLSLADPKIFPEFEGNVSVIDTRAGGYDSMDFWQDADMSPSAGGTHWNGNAKTYLNMGIAMADAMLLIAPGRCPFRLRAKGGAGSVTLTWKNGMEIPAGVRILRDGVEIAKAAPAGDASFIDRNVQPGIHEYEVEFTMPGAGCDALATTFNGSITELACSTSAKGLKLTWQNNMIYDAITVMRDGKVLEAALDGDATSYIDTSPPSKGLVSYTVAPAEARDTQTSLRLNLNLKGELGILDLVARGGINPTTRQPWKKGDQYHLAFVSSAKTSVTSQNLDDYDAFLTKLAHLAGISGNWRVIGSSWTDDARRHTSTYPKEDGEGFPIFLLDGTTIVANNYKDLWDGGIDAPIDRDEQGNQHLSGAVFTGSDARGTKNGPLGGSADENTRVTIGNCQKRERNSHWINVYGADAGESLRLYALSEKLTIADSSDKAAPVLKSITDERKGESIPATRSVNYTVTFSEPMKAATVNEVEFENASTAAVRIDSIVRTADPAVFEVTVTPLVEGSLQLRIARNADLRDLVGNKLDPQAAQSDETVISVSAAPQLEGELGILDVTANGGINPGTMKPWKAGDRYRLVFVTSAGTQAVSEGLGDYDKFLKKLVEFAGIGGIWKVIGSSATVNARDHTSTNPDVDGAGEPVFLIDGVTRVANGYQDMWDGGLYAPINRDERGNSGLTGRVFTGSNPAGVKGDHRVLGGSQGTRRAVTVGDCGEASSRWIVVYNATASSSLPVYALSDPLTVKRTRIPIESLVPDKKLFSIGVFSDNKGGHTKLTETLKLFRNRINPRFIIGLGDHFNSEGEVKSMEESAAVAYGSTNAFYQTFYPVIGDNEDRILPNGKGRPDGALKHGWFERCKIATRDGKILRDSIKKYESTHGDYYAVLEEKGLRIHLVALYNPDTMGKLFPESLTFGESTCKMIKEKYPNEPMIVVAHNGNWWSQLPESSPIFKADIIMEASLHRYIVRDEVPGKSLTFNTSQLRSGNLRGHVFEIKVFKDGFVLLAIEPPKCLMGPIELDEWRKVWVKPFGKKPYPVLDWDEIRRIAPEIFPPEKDGFNRERVLLRGFARRHKERPSLEEIEKELKSKDPETRAVALLGLGYSKDAGKASELLREYLPGQEDPGIQAHAVIALLRTHPGVAVPLLVDTGKDSMLTSVDLRTVARQKNCPDKVPFLTALARGRSGTIADHAIEAMALEFNRDELKGLTPVFIEALENEENSPTLDRRWVSATTALMKLGPEAKSALPVLIKRIDCQSRDVQWRVIKAIGSIGGPEARKAVPKLEEQLKSPDPQVRRVVTEALRNLDM